VRLPAVRVGGIYYVDPADLAQFLESLTQSGLARQTLPIPSISLDRDADELRAARLRL
jgi:hypothetical protein